MKKQLLILLIVTAILPVQIFAWQGMSTPMLHVEGRYLKNPNGENVTLYGGWMQPTESWFNGGGRWYSNPTDWTNPDNVAGMLNFLNDAATLMSDPGPRYGRNHGWYCTFVRLNTDAIGGWTHESGLVDQAQFNGWIQNFIVPYANHLRSRGLYLIISATGPINSTNKPYDAGITEQEQARLRTFWSTVASAPGVKNTDNIMFELMNEPVDIESYPGNGDWGHGEAKYFSAFRDWIQPIINDIRNTGANNVIWVPTLEWQGSPQQHAQYPFTGTNCGIAAHYYPAYGGCYDDPYCHNNLWNRNYKPATDQWPMLITENFWFPEDNGLCTGSTANYGNTLKSNIDAEGNVSYMIGFLGDLLDNLNNNLPENCNLSSKEGAQAAFEWWYQYNSCSPTSITPYTQVDDGSWQQTASITVDAGAKVKFGPQPTSGGSWSWSGGGTSGTSREQTIYPTSSVTATATYTNDCGAQSTQNFTVNVNGGVGTTVHLAKRNASGFALDGGNGGANGRQIYLWSNDVNNVNQAWVEIDRGNGYYSYQKLNTDYCIDGGNGGANGQAVILWPCDANNENQHWQKIDAGNSNYRLQKRNAPGYSIDGNNGGANDQKVYLWASDANNENQQWTFSSSSLKSAIVAKDEESISITEKILAYPNPVGDVLNLQLSVPVSEIVVYSMEGKLLYRQNSTSDKVEIDMSGYKPGIYFVKAIGQNETWTQKIIKK